MSTSVYPPRAPISSYTEEYTPWPLTKPDKIIPQSEWEQPYFANPNGMVSGYARDYPAHNVQPRQQRAPARWNGFGDPFAVSTTHQSEYKYVPTTPAQQVKPRGELELNTNLPMQSSTTIGDSYKQWNLPERYVHPRDTYQPPQENMDCKSSYSRDFFDHNTYVKLPPIRPRERKDSAKPFVASTETKEAFKGYGKDEIVDTPNYKPKWEYRAPREKFNPHTSYSEEFTPRKGERQESFKPRRSYEPPGEQFEVRTSYGDEFTPCQGQRPDCVRPKEEFQMAMEPGLVENASTYQREFPNSTSLQEAARHRAESYKPQRVYQPPTEAVQSQTTYSEKYSPRKLEERTQSFKPNRIYEPPSEPFGTSSTYEGEFQTIQPFPEKRESFKPNRIYEAPNQPFAQVSSYKSDYQSRSAAEAKQAAIRPSENLTRSGDAMSGETTFKREFTPKSPEKVQAKKPQDTPNLIKHPSGLYW